MIQYLCAKAFIDSQQDQMYKSLGIDTTRTQEYSEEQLATKAWSVRCAEGVGALLARAGEKLWRPSRKNCGAERDVMRKVLLGNTEN